MTSMHTYKTPKEIFFVTNGSTSSAYWDVRGLKAGLKNNREWTVFRSVEDPRGWFHWFREPNPDLVILKSVIGSAEGWADVTEQFVKDGEWAW